MKQLMMIAMSLDKTTQKLIEKLMKMCDEIPDVEDDVAIESRVLVSTDAEESENADEVPIAEPE